jgi:catechol 2,3-dioxygenase-like lactoylglutathione lyase family enzyme
MKLMRGFALFVAGIVVGCMGMQSVIAQQNRSTGHKINHVGIRVKDYQQSLDYYTKVLGFKEAYRFPSPNGAPTTTFLQVNKDTFIEMAPPAPDQATGLTHIGLYSDDAAASILQFRAAGVTLNDAQPSAQSGSKLSNITDPNGIRIEINEQPAGSLMRKAIDAWK